MNTPGSSYRRPPLPQHSECYGSSPRSTSSSYARRSPKRARSSPSPHDHDDSSDTDHVFLPLQDSDRDSQYPFATPRVLTTAHGGQEQGSVHASKFPPSSSPVLSVALATPSAARSSTKPPPASLRPYRSNPLEWAAHNNKHHPSTSPVANPKTYGARRGVRREMSVPLVRDNPQWQSGAGQVDRMTARATSPPKVASSETNTLQLSQSLSSFSLSHSTPPEGSDVFPDVIVRDPSSSTPPCLTSSNNVTYTPMRLPQLRRVNTPAPLVTRELPHPNTAPVIHSLLGSPFNTKPRPFLHDVTSPTWISRGRGEPATALEWTQTQPLPPRWSDTEYSPRSPTSPTTDRTLYRRASSDGEGSGSCTSASSAALTDRPLHSAAIQARTGALAIWDDDIAEEDSPTTPLQPTFGSKIIPAALDSSRPLLFYSNSTPLIKRAPGKPFAGDESSHIQTLQLNRLATSSAFDSPQQPCSPSDSFLSRRLNKSTTRKRDKRPVSCLMADSDMNAWLGQRRTSEPDSRSTDVDTFLARCHGERPTKSEMTPHQTSDCPFPDESSEPNELELELSPLRSQSKSVVPQLPSRPSSTAPSSTSGLPSSSSGISFFQRKRHDKPAMATPNDGKPTPAKVDSVRALQMPNDMSSDVNKKSAVQPATSTPVNLMRSFDNEKPSPAAFSSAGLTKKKRASNIFPRLKSMRRRNSSLTAVDTPSKAESSTANLATVQLDDFDDQDQLSPIKPLRTATFSRNSSHSRIPSFASEVVGRSGHSRIPSSASSTGSRGLRRKGSALFGSDSDKGSPLTPTRTLPLSTMQASLTGSTPSPSAQYPFDSKKSADTSVSPLTTPVGRHTGRVSALSRGPIPRSSNPMLSASYRNQSVGGSPTTPVDSIMRIPETFAPPPDAGPFERDYTVESALGTGEFSRVWKARHKENGDLWAIKQGKPFMGPKTRQRQREEVTILTRLAKIGHPHVIQFIDSWEQSEMLYIRTELLEWGDLAKYLASISDVGGIGEGRAWKVFVELASALDFIHGHGVIHLDLKPSNVLITAEGALKISDFGMSVTYSTEDGRYDTSTDLVGRDLEGDRAYLCPELMRDHPPTPAADVYSLGITILEAAFNVTVPSNGDAWVRLRNDNFEDLEEHYVERTDGGTNASPESDSQSLTLSKVLVDTICAMLHSNPQERMSLPQVLALRPIQRAQASMLAHIEGVKCGPDSTGAGGGWRAGPALKTEQTGWLQHVLRR